LWWTLKYEDIYLKSYETVRDLKLVFLGISASTTAGDSIRVWITGHLIKMYESFRVEGERAAA